MNVIKFYTTKDEYGFMSNFFRSSITIDKKLYITTEHFYQSMKFSDLATQEYIRLQANPKAAAMEGRRKQEELRVISPSATFRSDWEDGAKDTAMYTALVAKFTQHPELAEKLLATGNAYLVEDTTTTNDCYWGCGTEGNGLNMLGLQLMVIRNKLRNGFNLPKIK